MSLLIIAEDHQTGQEDYLEEQQKPIVLWKQQLD
jgi:hypothetical protein